MPEPLVFWRRHSGQVTREVADYGGLKGALGETDTAYRVAAQLQRLRDIEHLAETDQAPAELARYRRLAVNLTSSTLFEWRRYRGSLESAGCTLHWGNP